jgi:hypothetical protein
VRTGSFQRDAVQPRTLASGLGLDPPLSQEFALILTLGLVLTIAAFIGAGARGERIVTGLVLNDRELLLADVLPVAALAFEGLFAL